MPQDEKKYKGLTEEQRKFLDAIERSGRHLRNIINDLSLENQQLRKVIQDLRAATTEACNKPVSGEASNAPILRALLRDTSMIFNANKHIIGD